jgi:hypothetical protein
MVTLKKYKASKGGGYFKQVPGCVDVLRAEIFQMIKEGEVLFLNANEATELMLTIKACEPVNGNDTSLLNRIIRAGGFSSYLEFLNSRFS